MCVCISARVCVCVCVCKCAYELECVWTFVRACVHLCQYYFVSVRIIM